MSIVETRKHVRLGYPPRPTTGGNIPRLTSRDIATPKLNGMRVLMNRDGTLYNRKMEETSQMDRELRHEIHDLLLACSDLSVQWWDMEYERSQNMCALIDVCDGSDADYHARHSLVNHIDAVADPLLWPTRFGRLQNISGARCSVWRLPVYTTEVDTVCQFKIMEGMWQNIGDKFLWEGVVTVDTTLPYKLTNKQSMNMELHRKYRFR